MQHHTSCLEKLAPKKFCCRFELKVGCTYVGIILTIVMAACTVITVIQTLDIHKCKGCAYTTWKYAFGYSVALCVYCGMMFLVNLWFLWGVLYEKKSVVLAWVVISTMWLVQSSCLLIILIVEYLAVAGAVAWAISLFFTILFILILVYFLLAGYGYWVQLKANST